MHGYWVSFEALVIYTASHVRLTRLTAFASVFLVLTPAAAAAQPAVLPLPAAMELGRGELRIGPDFGAVNPQLRDLRLEDGIARALRRLEQSTGQLVSRGLSPTAAGKLAVVVTRAGQPVQTPTEDESYSLEVTPERVQLTAASTVGALRGLETLLQLVVVEPDRAYLPVVRITDQPRFPWRGLLLDVGRHFMPVDAIKRTLDGMAVVKLNVLHWHLSEDQGFRVESRRFPKLHQLGSDGRYYTQAEVREVVAYARARGVRVVPEFDMPGHATSLLVAYPEYASQPGPYVIERRFGIFDPAFDPTLEATYTFVDAFVGEMKQLFPDPFWHVGGDEVTGKHWAQNPRIARIQAERGWDHAALQAEFNARVAAILTRHGKRLAGWDEILHERLPKTALVQSWRGVEHLKNAIARGYDSILSAPYYLDAMSTTDTYYLADPSPESIAPEHAGRILGGEACQWTEHVDELSLDSRLWPRLGAVAERLWSPRSVRDVRDLARRLAATSVQLERVGLGHETHRVRMLRRLTGSHPVPLLEEFLRYVRPIALLERAPLQPERTQLTPLHDLADVASPDPWTRFELDRWAAAARGQGAQADAARAQLRRTFARWKGFPRELAALAKRIPLARQALPAAGSLARLGEIGLRALQPIAAAEAQRTEQLAALDELAKPQGLLRLAGVDAVRTLVHSAERSIEATTQR
jgi:hexosaminidase